MSNSSFSYGVAGNLRANAFSAPSGNYEFGGWATSVANATAGTVHRANQAAHGNLSYTNGATVNLYAIWKRTINFYSGLSKAKNTTRT
jgi:arabinogalactan endo-1,4-beta-galactosidase